MLQMMHLNNKLYTEKMDAKVFIAPSQGPLMNEEEWQFFMVLIGGGILAAAVIVNDLFSLQKFWARLIRSRRPPTPEMLVKAHTKHQRFFHHTHQRLFETTYVSFYLFALSFLGILVLNAFIVIQDITKGVDYNADERLLRLFYITLFFLLSRWYYRQEHHYTTAHKLVAILSCIIFIDLVHLITKADYLQTTITLILFWVWVMGILHAILSYEVNYARDVAFSIGIPFAVIYSLVRQDAVVLFLIIAPLFVLAVREYVVKSEKYKAIEHFFPNPLPFKSSQPHSFLKDVFSSLLPRETFAGCSIWEVLFWFSMTPVVLVPVTLYLQGREEQLQKRHDDIVEWSQNEYVLDPETVADRFGLTLVDTYPLLNELTEEGRLTLYESAEGLKYGLPPSEEMNAFIKKLDLRKTELPEKDRDLLEYIAGKRRISPPKTVIISILERPDGIEVSLESAGGTISALKWSTFMDRNDLRSASFDINRLVGLTLNLMNLFGHYQIKPRTFQSFLKLLQEKGKTLLECAGSESLLKSEMSHIVLETNANDIPFELMWADEFFALKYAIGRRLRIAGPAEMRSPEDSDALRALIIADPKENLREAVAECEYVEAELKKLIATSYIRRSAATCENVRSYLRSGYTIIHYAGHVDESGLQLSDGILDSDTIRKTVRGRPIVFINGCKSAGVVNTELAEAFLRGGAVGYIGSLWDIHDVAAAQLAITFYRNSLHHYSLGEALRMAKESAFHDNNIAWLCFVLFGDPTLRLI